MMECQVVDGWMVSNSGQHPKISLCTPQSLIVELVVDDIFF